VISWTSTWSECQRSGGGGVGGGELQRGAHLHKVGELVVARRHEPVHLVLDLALLGLLDGDVPLGQARLALPVLQQEEADLRRYGRTVGGR